MFLIKCTKEGRHCPNSLDLNQEKDMKEKFKQFVEKMVTLTEEEWNAFEPCLQTRTLKKGDHFLLQGEVCRHIGFVASGFMRLYYLSNGQDITKSINFENTFCGSYASFISGEEARFNVVAMEPSTLVSFHRNDLFALYDRYPNWQKMGRMSIERTFVNIERREASLLLDSPEQRYLHILEQDPILLQRVPLKHLASYLGITPETLSRVRNKIKRY